MSKPTRSDMEKQLPEDDESRIRDALRAVRERFRSLAEHSRSFLYQCDPSGTITYCSPAVDRSTGYTAEEMTGTELTSYFPPGEHKEITRASGDVLSGKRAESLETNLLCKDGSLLPVEIALSPLMESDKIVGIQGVARNIADRRRLEKDLVDLDLKYRSLLDKLPVGVSLTTIQGDLFYLNDVAIKILQYETADEVLPGGILALYKDPAERKKTMGILKATGKLENYPLDFSSKTGETVHTLTSATVENDVISGIIVDITELKHTEEKLIKSQDRLRRLASSLQSIREEERKRISREIHDELGQSLTALNIDLTWLGNELAEDHRELLKKISSMSRRVDENIEVVKEIATQLRPKVLDDLGLAAAIEWQSGRFQERTGISCEVTFDPEDIALEQELSTNVFRIFQETLTNITRHANATRVDVSLRKETDRTVLKVVDNGRGITREDISSPHAIGLLGMRERVYPWSGEVAFQGRKGKGTTVTVTIPH